MSRIIALVTLALVASTNGLPKASRFLDGRIVNGTDVPPGKYPFMVSLNFYGSHNCGGTIINDYWVLTAAHCVSNYQPSAYRVYSGSVDTQNGGTYRDAVEMIAHENYNSFTIENDVGLIRVATPFVWDENTAPVPLPVQGQVTNGGENATVIGWGTPRSGGSVMQILQEVDYWTVSDQECMDAHSYDVFETNICAYYPGGGKGQCSGDSGGPLWVKGQQVGIVSWSVKPCTVAPYPGVFTEVSAFIDWINAHVN